MKKRANEKGGNDVTKTSDYGKVYMDQRKETLEVMMGRVIKNNRKRDSVLCARAKWTKFTPS
jgi:hypothetical protein